MVLLYLLIFFMFQSIPNILLYIFNFLYIFIFNCFGGDGRGGRTGNLASKYRGLTYIYIGDCQDCQAGLW